MPKNHHSKEFSFKQVKSRAGRRAAGLCIECGGTSNRVRCVVCRAKNNESQAKQREKKIASGVCLLCGVDSERTYCNECRAKSTTDARLKREVRATQGKCLVCGKDSELNERSMREEKPRNAYCKICWLKTAAARTLGSVKHWRILLEKLEACGWRCPYTGEVLVLGENVSFDHVDPISRFPEKQHDPTNIEAVSWQVNMMKSDLTKSEFLEMIDRIHCYVNNNG